MKSEHLITSGRGSAIKIYTAAPSHWAVIMSNLESSFTARRDWFGIYHRAILFHAQIGIADVVAPEGDCEVIIRTDQKILWQGRLRGTDQPQDIRLDLTGARSLALHVELGERYDIGDHVVLANAWILAGE